MKGVPLSSLEGYEEADPDFCRSATSLLAKGGFKWCLSWMLALQRSSTSMTLSETEAMKSARGVDIRQSVDMKLLESQKSKLILLLDQNTSSIAPPPSPHARTSKWWSDTNIIQSLWYVLQFGLRDEQKCFKRALTLITSGKSLFGSLFSWNYEDHILHRSWLLCSVSTDMPARYRCRIWWIILNPSRPWLGRDLPAEKLRSPCRQWMFAQSNFLLLLRVYTAGAFAAHSQHSTNAFEQAQVQHYLEMSKLAGSDLTAIIVDQRVALRTLFQCYQSSQILMNFSAECFSWQPGTPRDPWRPALALLALWPGVARSAEQQVRAT